MFNKIIYRSSALLLLLFCLLACQEELIPIPKPRLYPKVEYPTRNYTSLDKDYCAFRFEYPDYMKFEQDTTLGNQKAKHACWFNLNIPVLNGVVHFTYTDISGDNASEKLFDTFKDSYDLTEKHNRKAGGRKTIMIEVDEKNLYGVSYSVEGDVASPYHFLLTDSTNHALWASLYFNSRPQADSMRPIVDFVKEDLEKIITSFEWNAATN